MQNPTSATTTTLSEASGHGFVSSNSEEVSEETRPDSVQNPTSATTTTLSEASGHGFVSSNSEKLPCCSLWHKMEKIARVFVSDIDKPGKL